MLRPLNSWSSYDKLSGQGDALFKLTSQDSSLNIYSIFIELISFVFLY